MNEWKAATGRVTLFPASPNSFSQVSGLQLFHHVWGTDPDNFQKQDNPLMPSVAQGRRGGIAYGCSVHPSRLDFIFGPVPPPAHDVSKVTFELIENARQLRRGLMQVFDGLGGGGVSEGVARVALNLQILVLKPNFVEANEALAEVIPKNFGLKITDEEDVIFQVNKPYASGRVPGVTMNAVTKWSVARLQVMKFSVPAGGTISPATTNAALGKPQRADFIAASVALDVNSAPLDAPIPSEGQSLLMRESLVWVEQKQAELGINVEGLRNV